LSSATVHPVSSASKLLRVLVIAAVRLYREGLAEVLDRTSGFRVVGSLPDVSEAAACMGELAPDIVLLDMTLPNSHAVVREIAQHAPNIQVVAIGMGGSEAEIVSCAEAGITGFLSHDASLDELVGVVETASRGEMICSPQLAAALVRRLATLAATQHSEVPEHRLTRREREVAGLVERNLTNKEIATHLGIEVATVKNHVHNLLEKLSVHRRDEAARLLSHARKTRPAITRPATMVSS